MSDLFPFDIAGKRWYWQLLAHPFGTERLYSGPTHPGAVWNKSPSCRQKRVDRIFRKSLEEFERGDTVDLSAIS